MSEEDSITLRDHLRALRATTLERLAQCAEQGTTEAGLLALVSHVQATLDALEAVADNHEAEAP